MGSRSHNRILNSFSSSQAVILHSVEILCRSSTRSRLSENNQEFTISLKSDTQSSMNCHCGCYVSPLLFSSSGIYYILTQSESPSILHRPVAQTNLLLCCYLLFSISLLCSPSLFTSIVVTSRMPLNKHDSNKSDNLLFLISLSIKSY